MHNVHAYLKEDNMAITKDFKTIRLTDMLEATGLRGKNLNFLTDLTKEQLLNLFD